MQLSYTASSTPAGTLQLKALKDFYVFEVALNKLYHEVCSASEARGYTLIILSLTEFK